MRNALALACLALLACATGTPAGAGLALRQEYSPFAQAAPARELPISPAARAEAVALARKLVGRTSVEVGGRRYPSDCTGLVLGVYAAVGLDLLSSARPEDNGVTAIYRFAQRHGRVYQGGWPASGDLVFFRDTYDRNRDGRLSEGLTHVGIVEETGPDGTVVVIHRVKRGVVRYRMNLSHPDLRSAGGERLNDYLRAASAGRPAALTGQLFAGYAAFLGD